VQTDLCCCWQSPSICRFQVILVGICARSISSRYHSEKKTLVSLSLVLPFCRRILQRPMKKRIYQDYSGREIPASQSESMKWALGLSCFPPDVRFCHGVTVFVTYAKVYILLPMLRKNVIIIFAIPAIFCRMNYWYLFADPIYCAIIHKGPWITSDFISALCSVKTPVLSTTSANRPS